MKTTKIILLAMLISLGLNTMAQVAINNDGSAPDESAILDLKSNNGGLLLPRMNTIQISGITNAAAGLIVFNTDSSDFYGFNGSKWLSIWNTGDTLADWYCGNQFTDSRDNKNYTTVQIGNQCWMAENLAYLPSVSPPHLGSETSPYYYVYDYYGTDVNTAKDSNNYHIYGVLYNWPAAMNGQASSNSVPSGVQGICPSGWHLPSDEEWKILEGEVDSIYGYPDPIWDNPVWRGTDVGGNLKETDTTHWSSPNTGATNSSGFTALPAGYRYHNQGEFRGLGLGAHFITSAENGINTEWLRHLNYGRVMARRYNDYKSTGYSVRCLMD